MTYPLSTCRNFRLFGVLPGSEFAAWKICIIKNSEETNFSDFKRLVVNNKFAGSDRSLIVMQIEQSEVFDKIWVTKCCAFFFTKPGVVTNLRFFSGFKTLFQEKNPRPGF